MRKLTKFIFEDDYYDKNAKGIMYNIYGCTGNNKWNVVNTMLGKRSERQYELSVCRYIMHVIGWVKFICNWGKDLELTYIEAWIKMI